tara:strand:- start:1038 stop:2000 length:963 start_codon:yes stop_codon:yes gene_type:complete
MMFSSEEEFLEFLKNNAKNTENTPSDWLGIGDDAAVIKMDETDLIFCTDAMVEDTHFKLNQDFFNVGWKSIVSNQSDIAAMGGFPIAFTVTLGINKNIEKEKIDRLYEGINHACQNFGGTLIGGDTVSSKTNFISVAAIGKNFISGKNMTRDNAKPGDIVALTGQIGNSIAGFEISEKDINTSNKFTEKFFHPIPRIKESKLAIENGIVCSMDLSDGLIKDLYRICKASNVKIEIDFEDINYDQDLDNMYKGNIENKILSSGEEYELILIGPTSKIKNLEGKIDIKIIGRVSESNKPILEFYKNKKSINLLSEGFDHFGK